MHLPTCAEITILRDVPQDVDDPGARVGYWATIWRPGRARARPPDYGSWLPRRRWRRGASSRSSTRSPSTRPSPQPPHSSEQDRLAARAAAGGQAQGTAEVLAIGTAAPAQLTPTAGGALEEAVGFQLAVLPQPMAHAGQVLGGFHREVSASDKQWKLHVLADGGGDETGRRLRPWPWQQGVFVWCPEPGMEAAWERVQRL